MGHLIWNEIERHRNSNDKGYGMHSNKCRSLIRAYKWHGSRRISDEVNDSITGIQIT